MDPYCNCLRGQIPGWYWPVWVAWSETPYPYTSPVGALHVGLHMYAARRHVTCNVTVLKDCVCNALVWHTALHETSANRSTSACYRHLGACSNHNMMRSPFPTRFMGAVPPVFACLPWYESRVSLCCCLGVTCILHSTRLHFLQFHGTFAERSCYCSFQALSDSHVTPELCTRDDIQQYLTCIQY